jgi:hypothetical protein
MQIIVYAEETGEVVLLTPNLGCGLLIEEIAEKDVPQSSRPYLILDDAELPDRALRDRWIIQDGAVMIDNSIPPASLPPNWQSLYESLLSGDLRIVFNSVTQQAIANPSIAVGLIHVNSAITQVRVEQALADALNVLQLSGFTFTEEHKSLWNNAIAELNFSDRVKL